MKLQANCDNNRQNVLSASERDHQYFEELKSDSFIASASKSCSLKVVSEYVCEQYCFG
jgi:hypothetical protein